MPEESESTKGICKTLWETPITGVAQGKKCLLTIAIDKYDKSKGYGELKYPVANAAGISEELKRSYGFMEVISINNHECTEKEIRKAIIDARDYAGPDGQLIVFFTGHGVTASNDDGYWIPFDSEKKPELNCSVFEMLRLLMAGQCAQVLLLVDCCFSGTAAEAAYPLTLFKRNELQHSVFSVITAGNKYEEVPDKSIFFEALIDILRYHSINTFNELVAQLEEQVKNRGSKTKLTHHSTVKQFDQNFLLQREDRASYFLAKSFLDLNYKDQSRDLAGVTIFNMIYLRGSRDCGHHVFLHRYFQKNGDSISSMFNYPECKISFGGEEKSASYNLWEQLAIRFGLTKPNHAAIIQSLMNVLLHNNFLITVIIKGSCTESDMETALKDFWEKIFDYSKDKKEEVKKYSNHVYFFIWDMRGNGDTINDIVTIDKFKPLQRSPCTKLLALPVIKEVDDTDLYDWHDDTQKNYKALKNDEKFKKLDFEKIQNPRTVMNVIAQIEEQCDSRDAFTKLFSSIKFS